MSKKLFGGSGKGRFAAKTTDVSIMDEEPQSGDEALQQEAPETSAGTKAQRSAGAERPVKERKKKPNRGKKAAIWLLSLLLLIESAYCVIIFTDLIPPLAALRSIYITTAMSTMRHQYLATALIPGDIVMDVVHKNQQAQLDQLGVNSGWEDVEKPTKPTEPPKSPSSGFSKDSAASMLGLLAQDLGLNSEDDDFFETFHELDEDSVRAYVDAHPESIENGWNHFLVNEAGLDDEGTSMMTTQGDQVLAVDAENGLMVIRITGSTYRGVLVIGKDPSRLKVAPTENLGGYGQRVGEIAKAHNGLVGMTGSGFEDLPGQAEGSHQTGAAMFSGKTYGVSDWGNKRIELHRDNRLYVVDAHAPFGEECTDATEWTPALIVDGVDVSGQDTTYTALNPRACLGQTRDEAIMFLGIEGRRSGSLGCSAQECAKVLARYGAYQAMNVDGGTSAMIWYQGEVIMRCSNPEVPNGRKLPNAWVYCAETVPNP